LGPLTACWLSSALLLTKSPLIRTPTTPTSWKSP